MNLTQQKLDSLTAQLNLAYAKNPVSGLQIALLKAQIRELQAKVGRFNARITKCEVYAGSDVVNGRCHGSKWKNRWEVTVCFDSKEEAEKFAKKVIAPQDEIVFCGGEE